jgi:hypothetical protein
MSQPSQWSQEQREALVLAWNHGMATAELARHAGLTTSAVTGAVAYFRSKGYWLRPRPKGPNAGRRVSLDDVEHVRLVREFVKCGKPTCRCTHGMKHGPHWYLRHEVWDPQLARDRDVREYVRKSELRRVRRWVQRVRTGMEGGCLTALGG